MAAAEANPLVVSLAERLRELRGDDPVPASLLDVEVRRVGDAYVARPRDWEALRSDEALARPGVPYWARLWPSGEALAAAIAAGPSLDGKRVLELGCGLGLPSVAAAKRGASVLATDAASDAVVFAAHNLALNEQAGEVAVAAWAEAGGALVDGGPWDLVIAADVLYLDANVEALLRLLPRLGAEVWIADPNRRGARDFLAAARKRFTVRSERPSEDVSLHRLTPDR
jgi:predicted nicotinamide N-methyase